MFDQNILEFMMFKSRYVLENTMVNETTVLLNIYV
jgi:hypothetical protein